MSNVVLATTGARRAGNNCVVVEGGQWNTTSRSFLSKELRICARNIPRHHSLCHSPSIWAYKFGGCDNGCWTTSVTRPRRSQRKVLWHSYRCVGGSWSPYANLERAGRVCRILRPRVNYTSPAAVCDLLVIWCSRQQVHNCRSLHTRVGDVAFVFGTITLLCSLASHHAPDDLLLRPCPS